MSTGWLPIYTGSLTLTESARAVLRTIARTGPATRPQLSASLRFSKPTMSAAVNELERYGLVAPIGVNRGSVGRTSVSYGLGPNAGFVIGIDCGTTHVHAIACRVDGAKIGEVEQPIAEESGSERFDMLESVIAEVLRQCGSKAAPLPTIMRDSIR